MDEERRPRRRGTVVAAVVLLGCLAAAAYVGWTLWTNLSEAEISQNGLIALGLGAGLSVVLGVGLMILVFISSRRGFDEEVGKD